MVKVILPVLGENIEKVTISYWYCEEGSTVAEGDDLVEVATDKATFNVPAPYSGIVKEIAVQEGDVAEIGTILAVIEEDTVLNGDTDK